jgi:hypothetical protein
MSLNVILLILLIVVGVAYFSVRNRRKTRDRAMKK